TLYTVTSDWFSACLFQRGRKCRGGHPITLPHSLDRIHDPLRRPHVREPGLRVDRRPSPRSHRVEKLLNLRDDRLGIIDFEILDVDQLAPLEIRQVLAAPDLVADLAHLDLV